MSRAHVAVIGGGFSGTLQAIHLLERGARVTLIERSDRLAHGVAYSTPHADHLLNVRAAGMSAFPDRPEHFADWLQRQGCGDGSVFAERRRYGTYVESLLDAAGAEAGQRLQVVRADAVDVVSSGSGEVVQLAGGERIEADAVVLALGNLPPEVPRVVAAAGLADGIYRADPWAADLADGLGPEDKVLLIGTGLTAIDAALLLDSAGFCGRILALSRRGLLPRAHSDPPVAAAELDGAPEPRCTALIRLVREQAKQVGWRAAVDGLRPVTQTLWAQADVGERRRYLRHLRPWWDVHRHRIAPSIADRIDRLTKLGRLQVAPGKIQSVKAEGKRASIQWRPRGETMDRSLPVRRIVNCTGPSADITRAGEPLLAALLASGRVRPDPCRIGLNVNAQSRTLSRDGASASLCAVGPITKGAFWEIVAVPDIRHQVRAVADALTA